MAENEPKKLDLHRDGEGAAQDRLRKPAKTRPEDRLRKAAQVRSMDRLRKPAAGILLLLWVLALAGCGTPADEYHENISCFVLLAGVAFASLFLTGGPDPKDRRGRRILLVNELLFPLVLILAHYQLFLRIVPWGEGSLTGALSLIVIALGGAFVARRILLLLHDLIGRRAAAGRGPVIGRGVDDGRRSEQGKAPRLSSGEKSERTVRHPALIPFLIVSIQDLLFLTLCLWPGVLSDDSIRQIEQIMTGEYLDHHPFWHTQMIRLFLTMGLKLTGDINAAAAFYSAAQILIMAGAFACIASTVYAATRSRILWICVLIWYILIPYNMYFGVTMWKDVPYALAMGLFIAVQYRLINGVRTRRNGHWLMLCLSGMGVSLMRKNGWMVFLAAFAAFLLIYILRRRSRGGPGAKATHRLIAVLMAGMLLLSWAMMGPAERALGVTPGEPDEAFSIPWQQIARVAAEGKPLTPEQYGRLEQFIDVEYIPEFYCPDWYDPIKLLARDRGGDRYLSDPEKRREFLSLWADIGRDHPLVYLAGWIEQTKGYWNGGYRNWVWLNYVDDNDRGLSMRHGNRAVYLQVHRCAQLFFGPGLNVFFAIGFHTWIAWALLMVCLWYRRNAVYCVPPLVNTLTLIMATPLAFEFRYIYSLFVCMPLLVMAAVTAPKAWSEPRTKAWPESKEILAENPAGVYDEG